MSFTVSFRSLTVATALLAAGASASAGGLTLPANILKANSVQQFSNLAQGGFRALDIVVTPLGNATAVPDVKGAFSLPITSITISPQFKIASGDAKGSALEIARLNDDDIKVGLTLANFTINYETKQVLADTTPLHGITVKQMPLFNFHTATPLGLKYKFPLTITGHEVLDDLRLTPQAKAAMTDGLQLPVFALPTLENDFGTLTQDISTQLRIPAVSTRPYVPAP